MGITDKILLVLLIILLPIGVLVSKQLFSPSDEEIEDERVVQLQKIENLLDEIAQDDVGSSSDQQTPYTHIKIHSVEFASASGILKVTGNQAKSEMMVRIAVIEVREESESVQNPAVSNVKALGKKVLEEAVEPLSDGSFMYEYLPDISSGIIELTAMQNGHEFTVGYDVGQEREVYRSSK